MRHRRPDRALGTPAMRAATIFASAPFVVRTLTLGILALIISGNAHAAAQPSPDRSEETADLVESIVAGEASLGQVPANFAGDMGYTPVSVSGTLRHPSGGCSTPVPVGPDRFATACQTHDLGYDLLRYAEMEGERLSARARFELDLRLYLDLLETCENPSCPLTATAYYGAVSVNSIRQGYKTPHEEPSTPWMALVVGVLGLGAAGGLPSMRARFDNVSLETHG